MVKGSRGPSQTVSRSNTASMTVRQAAAAVAVRAVAVERVLADVEEQSGEVARRRSSAGADHVGEAVGLVGGATSRPRPRGVEDVALQRRHALQLDALGVVEAGERAQR
jgi:hypothetical protein